MSSFKDIIGHGNVLVDFHATWCGPCHSLAPILKEYAQEKGDALKVIKIDIDKNQALATKLGIQGVPTMILYKDGVQVWRKSGVLPKHMLEAELAPFVN